MPNKNDSDNNAEARHCGRSPVVALSPELVRMAQARVKECGASIDNELARLVVEEAIVALPEELDMLVDGALPISQSNVLAGALGANDLVVAGRQIDVRPLSLDQTVTIDRVLIGSPYLAHGSLVVRLCERAAGQVVAFVTPNLWLKAEAAQKDSGSPDIVLSVQPDENFALAERLVEISAGPSFKLPSISQLSDLKSALGELVNNRETLTSARQKQIFAYLSTRWEKDIETLLPLVESVPVSLSSAKVKRVVSDAALWNGKVERLAAKLSECFPAIGEVELRHRIDLAGERYGSQLTAPRYRRALLAELIALQMAAKNTVAPAQKTTLSFPLAKAQALVEKVLAGEAAVDAVKNVIGNQIAVDLALAIQKQRRNLNKLGALMVASAEELGFAYGQLALQPAYATHSQSEESGVDSVNEALTLFAASDLASESRALELEIANI
ncbi:MAG: hypothetical protein KGS72_22235 [Cyanobacteria bacterium REEB67]|nr:hypothetical protein [Cyanobacteria bacterium REEB67]